MNVNNELFVSILSTAATAEAAKQALREAIFWQIVNNTAMNSRTTESTFGSMRIAAETFINATSVEFFCNDKVVEMFNFKEGDSQRQLRTIQKLYEIVIQYHAWYEDTDGDGGDNRGFCWQHSNHHYRLIFR